MNKLVYATLPILAISLLTMTALDAYATSAFDEGWRNGESDYKNGNDKNPRCNSDIDAGTCAAYRTGYEAGWASASLLWPEDRREALARD